MSNKILYYLDNELIFTRCNNSLDFIPRVGDNVHIIIDKGNDHMIEVKQILYIIETGKDMHIKIFCEKI